MAGTTGDDGDDRLVIVFGDPGAGPAVPGATAGAATPATAPRTAPAGQAVEGIDYHVVAAGDTLSSIAALRLGDAQLAKQLGRLNNLTNPDALKLGQIIRLR